VEELDASPETKDERGAERQQDPTERERLQCLSVNWRNHGVTHTLGGVGERVEKGENLASCVSNIFYSFQNAISLYVSDRLPRRYTPVICRDMPREQRNSLVN
jgi:hypothetical protein